MLVVSTTPPPWRTAGAVVCIGGRAGAAAVPGVGPRQGPRQGRERPRGGLARTRPGRPRPPSPVLH
eukprot:7107813-Pyramimonas_sp.AAC.1